LGQESYSENFLKYILLVSSAVENQNLILEKSGAYLIRAMLATVL
jgi:hypothetical protein